MFEQLDHIMKDDIYEKLKDLFSPQEFEKELAKLREQHHNLLDDDALAFILLDMHKRNDFFKHSLGELRDGDYATLLVQPVSEPRIKQFTGKDGKEKELAEMTVSDGESQCSLTLWSSEQIDMVREGLLKRDTQLRVVNGRFKHSRYGRQISMGYWSKLEILEA